MKAWFLSDIHLKSVNERNGILLLRFLRSLLEDEATTHLFLLGDIFDIWVGPSSHFVDQFAPIIELLDQLDDRGVKMVYFEGNHDFHIEGFWQDHMGFEVYDQPHYFALGSKTVRCEHGDFINTEDKAYIRYRRFVRSPLVRKLALNLPGVMIEQLGDLASKKSRSHSRKESESHEKNLRHMIRAYTQRAHEQEEHFDILIAGHVHVRDEETIDSDGHKILSINLGSWIDRPAAYCLDGNQGKFVELE